MKKPGISTRLAVLVTAIVVVTASILSTLIISRLNTLLIDAAAGELERESQMRANRFTSKVDELVRDTLLVASVPPVQGYIRAWQHAGVDPQDGTSAQVWRQRMQVILSGVIRNKPEYLQVRFIGMADGGRELVRVDRRRLGDDWRAVEPDNLQKKADRPYVQQALKLKAGQVYLSEITLNREFGRIQQPPLPMLRAATPVRDSNGALFGVIVINLAVAPRLEESGQNTSLEHRYYVVNQRGQYLVHPDPEQAFAFEYGSARTADQDFQAYSTLMSDEQAVVSETFSAKRRVVSARRVPIGAQDSGRWISMIVVDEFDDITGVARTLVSQVAIIIAVLVIVAVLIGLWLSRAITRPIEQLADAVRDLQLENAELRIPEGLPAEAGELAAALDTAISALRWRTEQLEANNRELEQFAYIASHDLQEPVRTISSYTALLSERYGDHLDERGRKSLVFVSNACGRMHALIHGLLEYSRLGKQAKPALVNFNQMMEGVQADLESAIVARQASLDVPDLPTLCVMEVEMRMLFQNLIGNAIKFARPGVSPQIWIEAQPDGPIWQFSVSDNGLGIAPEYRDKVFMIFQRLQNRKDYDGTGIGLAHCRKVVEMHGGKIWIEDGRDGGTKFVFRIAELDPLGYEDEE